MDFNNSPDVEFDISPGSTKAVIEGKTAVPFKQLVQLILQRKVTTLFQDWGKTPVVLESELLTGLASAPQDNVESSTRVVLTGMGCGVLVGVFVLATLQFGLSLAGITLQPTHHLLLSGGLAGLAALVVLLSRAQRKNRADKIVEGIEKIASMMKR